MRVEALEPGELVVELRSGLRIAVGQICGSHDQPLDLCLEITRLQIALIPRQPAANLYRPLALGEDRDAVMGALAGPERALACLFHRPRRASLVGRFDSLKATDGGPPLVEPLQQPRQPAVDAVDVI